MFVSCAVVIFLFFYFNFLFVLCYLTVNKVVYIKSLRPRPRTRPKV